MTNDKTGENNIPEEPRAPKNFAMDDQPTETPQPGRRRQRQRNFAGQTTGSGSGDEPINSGPAAVDAAEENRRCIRGRRRRVEADAPKRHRGRPQPNST